MNRTYNTHLDAHKSYSLPNNLKLRLNRLLYSLNLDEHDARGNHCAFCEPTHRANMLMRALIGTLLESPKSGEIIEGVVIK